MKQILHLILAALPILVLVPPAWSDEPKNHDKDVVYDEAKVPPYDLPPLLVSSEGKLITTPEEWFNIRRPQIMALFGNLVYGIVPAPESPIRAANTFPPTTRAKCIVCWERKGSLQKPRRRSVRQSSSPTSATTTVPAAIPSSRSTG
jgi:hypothetical protein